MRRLAVRQSAGGLSIGFTCSKLSTCWDMWLAVLVDGGGGTIAVMRCCRVCVCECVCAYICIQWRALVADTGNAQQQQWGWMRSTPHCHHISTPPSTTAPLHHSTTPPLHHTHHALPSPQPACCLVEAAQERRSETPSVSRVSGDW